MSHATFGKYPRARFAAPAADAQPAIWLTPERPGSRAHTPLNFEGAVIMRSANIRHATA